MPNDKTQFMKHSLNWVLVVDKLGDGGSWVAACECEEEVQIRGKW